MKVGIFLFDDFETLDVFGPVEILGRINEFYQIDFYSAFGGIVNNSHGVSMDTKKLDSILGGVDIFIIPGGFGTRKIVINSKLLDTIKQIAGLSKYVLTVCTGSAVLAKTGLLDDRFATSNKRVFDWVITNGEKVKWIKKARWTVDEKFYTSSGVSAGMDMTLGFLADTHGIAFARNIAFEIEYTWQEDKDQDPFSV